MQLNQILFLAIVVTSLHLGVYARAAHKTEVRIEDPISIDIRSRPEAAQEASHEESEIEYIAFNIKENADLNNMQHEADISADSTAAPTTPLEGMNLDMHFKPLGTLGSTESINIIKDLPISTYFDVIKENFALEFSESTSWSRTRICFHS